MVKRMKKLIAIIILLLLPVMANAEVTCTGCPISDDTIAEELQTRITETSRETTTTNTSIGTQVGIADDPVLVNSVTINRDGTMIYTIYNSGLPGPYGELYDHSETKAVTVSSAGFTNITGYQTTGLNEGVVISNSAGTITVPPGRYKASANLSYSASLAGSIEIQHYIFVDGVRQNNCHSHRGLAVNQNGDADISTCGIEVTGDGVVILKVTSDDASDRTVTYNIVSLWVGK
jgi:hypothetical protein